MHVLYWESLTTGTTFGVRCEPLSCTSRLLRIHEAWYKVSNASLEQIEEALISLTRLAQYEDSLQDFTQFPNKAA